MSPTAPGRVGRQEERLTSQAGNTALLLEYWFMESIKRQAKSASYLTRLYGAEWELKVIWSRLNESNLIELN